VKARLRRGRLQLRERLNRYFRKEMESARVELSPGGDTAEELKLQEAASGPPISDVLDLLYPVHHTPVPATDHMECGLAMHNST
jgi:hypothetical protein